MSETEICTPNLQGDGQKLGPLLVAIFAEHAARITHVKETIVYGDKSISYEVSLTASAEAGKP